MIRRRIVIALLALGTVGGYAAGFASLHHRHHFSRCCDHDDRGRADRDGRDGRDGRGWQDRGDDEPR